MLRFKVLCSRRMDLYVVLGSQLVADGGLDGVGGEWSFFGVLLL